MIKAEDRGFVTKVVERLYGYDIFISYTRLDDPRSTFALALHALLTQGDVAKKRKPMRCFLDTREMPHDEELKIAIEHNIFASRFVLIIASPAASDHPWMCFEAEMAHKHGRRILVVDRGINWSRSTGLLKTKVGDVLSIPSNPSLISPDEAEIDAVSGAVGNLRRATDRRRIWTSVTLSLVVLLVAAFLEGIEASRERDAAIEQARIAESRRLAAESASVLANYPQRSLLLAVEAAKVSQTLHGKRAAAAEQSLREALAHVGGRLLGAAAGAITTRITVGRNFSADEWQLYFPGEKYRKTFDDLPGPDDSLTQKHN
jgi:hypothetical protein